ncbi:MAG: hypothetical protein H7Y07_14600, partial [Pyrinomonadaceae bacterium]|nr:hypothetical protein [Sphingobacteriaceae bacterium]
FNLFSDEFVDGNYIANNQLSVKDPLVKDDLLKAETWSVTEDALLFWLDIQIQLQNGQLFATPLANTRTNIKKTSSNATDVIGYFGASLIHSVESRVK